MLLDPDDRVLLLSIHDPAAMRSMNLPSPDFWLLPGGGVKPGETYEQAAVREVFEETGISGMTLGPCVWTAQFTAWWAPLQVIQRYYLARVGAGATITFAGHEPLEAATTVGYRWFTLAEIADLEATDTILPRRLAKLLADALHAARTDSAVEPVELDLS